MKFEFMRDRYRYVVLVVGFLCLSSISGNMLVYTYTTICEDPHRDGRDTQLFVLASGAILGVFPFNVLYNKYGARYVLLGAGIVSALATLFMPVARKEGFWLFVVLRFVQGVTYSADFAATGIICSQWASLKQHALFLSMLTCFSPLSKAMVNGIGALLSRLKVDCELEYYAFTTLAVPVFVLWFFVYDDHPKRIPAVSDLELEKINRGKTEQHINRVSTVPYKAILSNKVIWIVWTNAATDLLAGIFVQQYLPVYLNEVLGYDKESSGYIGIVAAIHIPIKIAFGYANDKIASVPERYKMIACNSIAVGLVGVVFIINGMLPVEAPRILRVLLVCSVYAWLATGGGGFYKCASLTSRQYAHFVIANVQVSKATSMAIVPILHKVLVHDKSSVVEWNRMFVLIGVSCIVANASFCWIATDEPQDFTKISEESMTHRRSKICPARTQNEKQLDYL
ncbi:major facilitator superfamily transporter [Aphelenchoides avenae]|nr:major facilitator superfamily transporter [Aphelenchus avenae]